MLKPYNLLENVLIEIENGLKDGIYENILADKFLLSSVHLRRLFKFAFRRTIGAYIRSRKLAASIEALLLSRMNVLDIALEYGFSSEQSYIRSFRREFGLAPGELRKSGKIVKVTPPLQLFDSNRLEEGLLFGPDIVMVPQFHLVGKLHHMSASNSLTLAPKAAIDFWENERKQIKNVINDDVYIGITRNINFEAGTSDYLPSVQVKNFNEIPQGLKQDTFNSSLCAKFRYIGQHHYYDLNKEIADEMYKTIWKFAEDKSAKYTLLYNEVYFERIDTRSYDGTYCQMEWYAPVIEKK